MAERPTRASKRRRSTTAAAPRAAADPAAGAHRRPAGGAGPEAAGAAAGEATAEAAGSSLPASPRLLVGLTGGMAAGKSTVARLLGELGCTVVDADRLVRHLYGPGEPGSVRVRELFGDRVLAVTGAVDHEALAALVFRDPAALRRLEAAIHPLVRDRFAAQIATARGIVVVEATRLVEAGWAPELDLVVTVEAPLALRRQRAVARGMDPEEADRRLAAQGEGEARRRAAQRVLVNEGDLPALRRQVEQLVRDLRVRLNEEEPA